MLRTAAFGLEWLLCGTDLTLDFVRWLARDGHQPTFTNSRFATRH